MFIKPWVVGNYVKSWVVRDYIKLFFVNPQKSKECVKQFL